MKLEEKLKQAALKAELDLLDSAEEVEWSPSCEFKRKIDSLLCKRRISAKRRIAVLVAAVILLAASIAILLPLMLGEEEGILQESSESNFYNNTVSEIEINAQPEYIPEGYSINSCTVWADGSLQIEYVNGENMIVFRSYPASEVDVSAFGEIIGNVDINGNAGFAANDFNGFTNNNIAWADGNYSYIITNSDGVKLDELVRIALSVNTETEESE